MTAMTLTLSELKSAIIQLPKTEAQELYDWIAEQDMQAWDEQIEADSISGKLDFLLKDAAATNTLTEL